MAAKVWAEATGVGSPRLPFEQGHGVEREVTAEEIKVLRKLFMHRLDWTKRYHTPEEFENIVADDRVFLELSEIGTRWDTSSSIVMIFELAKLMDPTITYESLKRYASVSLY